jgi:hypothetical protein
MQMNIGVLYVGTGNNGQQVYLLSCLNISIHG